MTTNIDYLLAISDCLDAVEVFPYERFMYAKLNYSMCADEISLLTMLRFKADKESASIEFATATVDPTKRNSIGEIVDIHELEVSLDEFQIEWDKIIREAKKTLTLEPTATHSYLKYVRAKAK
jgi:hypothetical protein